MRILLLTTMLIQAACGSQQSGPPKSADEINQLIGIADKALNVAQKTHAGAPAADVQEATREMRTALDAARDQTGEILRQVANVDHLGTKDPMGVAGCIGSHRMEVDNIEDFSQDTTLVWWWSMDVGKCAAAAMAYFRIAPPGDSSTLALALHIIDPIMLVARARGGLKKGALIHYLAANESIIAKLGPECAEKTGKASGAGQVSYQCAAYEVAIAVRPKLQPLADQVQMSP